MFKKLKQAFKVKPDTGVFYLYPSITTLEEIESKRRVALKRLGKTDLEIERTLTRKRPAWREHLGGNHDI